MATLDEVVARSISEPRFYMVLLGAFAAMAVFLAALGIFGVLSYSVVQRSREIGIRVALGAHPRDVLRMVLGHAATLALVGVLAGLAGALVLSRAIGSLLFELSPTDPADPGEHGRPAGRGRAGGELSARAAGHARGPAHRAAERVITARRMRSSRGNSRSR